MTDVGTNEAPPVENWRTVRRLIGHDNDVQDLGWSYDSSILVSVGLDSKAVVWSGHTFEKLKTLSIHQSHVKGITFDPANKYFATASDDRTVRIFRFTPPAPNSTAHDQTNNFVLERTISTPFNNSPLTAYFRRCSWSPEGNHIAAANAVNGPVSSVAIINRGSWDADINLIGHEAPVEVCAFSPRLYSRQPPEKQKAVDSREHSVPSSSVTVIACAGGDKSLSIWITSNPRPIVVAQDVAVKSISDLAWSPDGRCLFATALDGTILAVKFEDGELGYPMSLEENERSLNKFGGNRRGAGIAETTDGLLLEEKSKAGEIKGVEGRMGALMGDGHDSTADHATNGTTSGGPPPLANGASTPATRGQSPVVSESRANGTAPSTTTGPSAEPEKRDPYQAKLERLKQRPTYTKEGKKRIAPLLVSGTGAAESSLPQARLMTSVSNNQVKSDAAQSIVDLSKPFEALPKGGLAALMFGNKRKFAQLEEGNNQNNNEGGQGVVEKRVASASKNGAVPILANAPEGLLPAPQQTPPTGQQPTPDFIRPAVTNPCMEISQLRLSVPKVRTQIVRAIDPSGNPVEPPSDYLGKSGTTADLVFEARNPSLASLTGRAVDREPVRVTVFRGGQPLWQDFLPRTVLLVTGNQGFWAAACEDGSIYIWTPAGRRLVSALLLEAQAVILECNGPWLLCISAVGMCYVWNVDHLSSPHPPVSLQPVLDAAIHALGAHPLAAPSVTSARVNSEGRIVVALSNGEGFSYSPAMYVWQRISEPWWAVGSQYWNTADAPVGNLQSTGTKRGDSQAERAVSAGIIPFLERNTTNESLLRGRAYFLQRLIKALLSREGYEGFESSVSIAHLENRLAAALSLGAKDEFRLYLSMYAKRIGAEGLRMKVEELLKGLLGGLLEEDEQDNGEGEGEGKGEVSSSLSSRRRRLQPNEKEGRNWREGSETLCGWPREVLLKEVILAFGKFLLLMCICWCTGMLIIYSTGKHRDLQRVIVPYAKLLGVVEDEEKHTTGGAGDDMDTEI